MLSFKKGLSFVAGCFTEAFVGGAELVGCVAVTGYEIVSVGLAEGVEVARETYDADVAAAVTEEKLAAIHAQQEVLSQARAHMDATHEASVVASAAYNTTAQEVFAAGVEANPDMAALEALRVAADNARAAATAARKAMEDALLEVRKEEAVGAVAVGIIARTRAVLHAAWVGVGAGVRASYEVAPVLWKDHYGTVVVNHNARVAARKAAPAVVAPVVLEADVVQEADGTYATVRTVEVDVTEQRAAIFFATFGIVLVRMISTVVRVAWTVIKVAVRIITFPIRKLFVITRRTRTHTAA